VAVRCVTIVGKGQVEVRTGEVDSPGPGQVLVRADKTLISPGTERAGLLQLPNTKAADKVPYVGGDCWAGVVEQVGEAVTGFAPGDRVAGQLRHQELQLARVGHLFVWIMVIAMFAQWFVRMAMGVL